MKGKHKKASSHVREMRKSIAATGRSLDLHRTPVSGYVCLKLKENACQCSESFVRLIV